MNITVKGIFIKLNLDRVKKNLGMEKLREVETKYGQMLKFSAMTDYPVEEEIKLAEIVGQMFYPGLSPDERWQKMGEDDAMTFLDSQIGKVGLSLFFPNVKTGIKNASKLFALVHSGLITHSEINDNTATLYIDNNPYPPSYYLGFFNKILISIGSSSTVNIAVDGEKTSYSVNVI